MTIYAWSNLVGLDKRVGRAGWTAGLMLSFLLTLPAERVANPQAPHPLSAAEQTQVNDLIRKMTLEQKLTYIGGTGFALRSVPELRIPALEMSDGPFGTRSNGGLPSTTYAAGINLAAAWDRDLASRVGAGIGRDARARGVHFMLGPGVNIYKSPRNGRNFEYFGEDPYLAGQIAVGYITGMQDQGVSATVKHFMGNNSEYLRHDSDTIVDDRTAHELYLPAFEAAVKTGHVGAVMDSYNLINGEHATANSHMNIEVLRKEWGFDGVVMSDWDATYSAVGAANGGLDVEMPTGKFMNPANLTEAVRSGKVPEAVIDEKVRRVLTLAMRFGWLNREQRDNSISYFDERNQRAALDSAREGTVLLKNEGGLLPLDRAKVKTVLVVGPNAYPGVPVGGGSAGVVPFHTISAEEGMRAVAGPDVKVVYDPGVPSLAHLAGLTRLTTAPSGGAEGVTVESFSNHELQGAPVSSKTAPQIGLEGLTFKQLILDLEHLLPQLGKAERISVSHRFTGYLQAEKPGRFVIALENAAEGSGARLMVDGKVLYDGWKLVRAFQPRYTIELAAGTHKIVVEEWQENVVGGHLAFAMVPEQDVVNQRAKELAASADAVIVSVGYQAESEGEGADRSFDLPFGQEQLIRAMAAANRHTIVTVTSGGNVDSTAWLNQVPALLETWYSGEDGGRALGEIVFGDVNPSGHLPVTFERRAEDNPSFADYYPVGDTRKVEYKDGIFVGYRGYEKNKTQPLFPFGFGLSYTTFRFANLKVQPGGSGNGTQATASFDVTNTGSRKGAEVAQVYVGEDRPKVERPAHELKGFERVELAAGETRHVTVPLDARAFSYWDTASQKWVIGSENFTISVGDSIANLPLHAPLTLRSAR